MKGKQPYVKKFDEFGKILNPIEKSYSVAGESRKQRRAHLQKDRFSEGIRVIGSSKFYAVRQYIAANKKKGYRARTVNHLIPA